MGLIKYCATVSCEDNIGDVPGEMGVAASELTKMGTGRTATAIAAGKYHNCAILDNESIKCWGSNNAGQLGLGNTNYRGDNSSEMGDNLPVISL
jgi:alpha-tubulin suppressor-like RCC1 family protein